MLLCFNELLVSVSYNKQMDSEVQKNLYPKYKPPNVDNVDKWGG